MQGEDLKKRYKDTMYSLFEMKEVEEFSVCKPSCIKVQTSAKKIYDRDNFPKFGSLWLSVNKEVTVLTRIRDYDLFDFVVEFGSALGKSQ